MSKNFKRAADAACIIVFGLIIAACHGGGDTDAPLAFVPADTPFLIANEEPPPDAMTDEWSKRMATMWPSLMTMYDSLIAKLGTDQPDTTPVRVARAVMDEIRTRDSREKWAEVGLGYKVHSALYGIGMMPVLRLELVNADAFRAMIARIEQKSGAKLATARVGDQDVWTFGDEKLLGLMAIEKSQLVVTAIPANADDALKRRVLGLDRPEKTMADSGAFAAFNKAQGFIAYGSGWIDTRRVLALSIDDGPTGVAAFARAFGSTPPSVDATCRTEYTAMAERFPEFVFGYTDLKPEHMAFLLRLVMAPDLAQSLAKIVTVAPPGPKTSQTALLDAGVSLPLLAARDFISAQADAVTAKPYQCTTLAPLNQQFAEAKTKLGQTVPPPASDLTGIRVVLDTFAWPENGQPDVSGTVAVGSTNPAFLASLAQMSVPSLRTLKIEPDGKPVTLPADAIPATVTNGKEIAVAMTKTTLGAAIGKDQIAALGGFVAGSQSANGEVLHASYSGAIYRLFGDMSARFSATMPPEQRKIMDQQRAMYATYEKWFKRLDIGIAFTPRGIEMTETVDLAP